jgi:cell division septum initiation protein DivIVA
MPASQPSESQPEAASRDAGEEALEGKLAYSRDLLRGDIVRSFPRSFRGYHREAVQRHLELVAGWLSLSGLDDLIRERFNAQDPIGRQLRAQAETDAKRALDEARQEADRHMREARDEAHRVLEAAHQEAEQVRAQARREAERHVANARSAEAADRQGAFARLARRAQRGLENRP